MSVTKKRFQTANWMAYSLKDRINYDVEFMNRKVNELTNDMWDELEKIVVENNIKIGAFYEAFHHTKFETFNVPKQYEYLFQDVDHMEGMFRNSNVKYINFNVKSSILVKPAYMFYGCEELEKVNISFNYVSDLSCCFERCGKLIYLKLKINNSQDSPINMERICYGCASLKFIDIRLKYDNEVIFYSSCFKTCDTIDKLISFISYDTYPHHISNSPPKYCQSVKDIWHQFNKSIIHVEIHNHHISKCKSLIV